MKSLLFTLAFVMPILAECQCSTSLDVAVGIFSTNHVYRTEDYEWQKLVDVGHTEKAKVNWSAEALFRTHISSHLYLKFGIQLYKMGHQSIKRTKQVFGKESIESLIWQPVEPQTLEAIQYVQVAENNAFLGVPLILGYTFGSHRLRPFAEIGGAPSLYVRTRLTQKTNIGREKRHRTYGIPEYNKIQITGQASVGISFAINKDIDIYGAPTVRYHFTPAFDQELKEYRYGIGQAVGLRRSIS